MYKDNVKQISIIIELPHNFPRIQCFGSTPSGAAAPGSISQYPAFITSVIPFILAGLRKKCSLSQKEHNGSQAPRYTQRVNFIRIVVLKLSLL